MRESVLIVDDNDSQLKSIVAATRQAGFDRVTVAHSEDEAYDRIRETDFSLAVVDVMLTPQNKWEGLRVINRLHEKLPNCRIIGLTALAGENAGVECINAGAQDFVYLRWPNPNRDSSRCLSDW